MKAYVKEIGGRVHPLNEDAHYAATIKDRNKNEWGLFMVADGLSTCNGTIASHLAVEHIGKKLVSALETENVEDYVSLIRNAVASANEALETVSALVLPDGKDSSPRPATITTCTTLDLVLLSKDEPNQFYVAH
ncbi:MAG: PP2C family serine/threonine-protein phosphatase, partial [Nanoarchaeota archaeon]